MVNSERMQGAEKKASVWDSRLFKGGGVVAIVAAGLGIGFLVEIGAVVAAGGAGWTRAFGKSKQK